MKTTDHNTTTLEPGQSIEINRTARGWVTLELSCDGRTMRYIRHTENSFEVFEVFRTIKV